MFKIKNGVQGFTLLELLVVVLIIGILAAIALPQYKLAVDKTEFAKLRFLAKTFADAYKNFYMVNSKYPHNFEDLDVSLPDGYTKKYIHYTTFACGIMSDFYCCMAPESNVNSAISCGKNNYKFGIWIRYPERSQISYCVAAENDERAVDLCKHISGKKNYNACTGFFTPEGITVNTHCQYRFN